MRFAILGSGRGSNAEALLRAWRAGHLGRAEPVAIFSDEAEARILGLGKDSGIPGIQVDPGPFRTRFSPEAEAAFVEAVNSMEVDLVVLAGFMRVLKAPFLKAFPDCIINLHPSLLPSFKGLEAIRQAWEYGVKVTGCTVHRVSAEVDGGEILDQEAVRVEKGDTLETLTNKVHAAEHRLLPRVVAQLAQGNGR